MEIPTTIFGFFGAAIFSVFLTLLYRGFQFSNDLEIDFNATIFNLKSREINIVKEFIDSESSRLIEIDEQIKSSENSRKFEERIKKLMQDRWKNAYDTYKVQDLINKLKRKESAGQIWCIVGIVFTLISLLLYLMEWKNTYIYKGYLILFIWFIPLLNITYLFCNNLFIIKHIKNMKNELEQIWMF